MDQNRRIGAYVLITFGIVWAICGVGMLGLGITASSGTAYTTMAALCMLAPAAAAIVMQRAVDKASWAGLGLRLRGTHWGILAITVVVGMSIVPLSLWVSYILAQAFPSAGFGEVALTTDHLLSSINAISEDVLGKPLPTPQLEKLASIPPSLVLLGSTLGAVAAAFTVNLPFMLGEELGWRGYLWQRTQHWSGLRRIAFTGTVWGLWHAPLILVGHNYPGYPAQGVVMMTLLCLVLGVLFDWTRTRSGSIWSSCILHGIINGSAGAFMLFAKDGHPLFGSVAGVAGILSMLLIAAVLVGTDATYRQRLLHGGAPMAPQAPWTTTISNS